MKIIKDIVYGNRDTKNQVLDLYLPENDSADVLIYFHGGGLAAGDKVCGVKFDRLVDAGKIVISANYRMYPTAVYPEFLRDAAAVVDWAKKNLGSYKNVQKIFIGGSSAGAYISAMLAYDPKYLGVYRIKPTDINGYIIDSAQMTTHFNVLRERGINTKRILVDEAAPVYHINENTQFPNALLLYADNDMPCRLEQNRMFLKTAEMFECPKEKIQHRLMEGFQHCGYTGTDLFADIVLDYMNTTN